MVEIIIKVGNNQFFILDASGSRARDGKPRHKRLSQTKQLEQLITNEVINQDIRELIVYWARAK